MMKRNPARMQYQKDTLSAFLCILSIVFNVYYFICAFSTDTIKPDVILGLDVLINIIFMMVTFLASEKLKVYSKNWGAIVILMGVFEIARILILPEHYRKLDMLGGFAYIQTVAALALAGASLIAAGLNSAANLRVLKKYAQSAEGGQNG